MGDVLIILLCGAAGAALAWVAFCGDRVPVALRILAGVAIPSLVVVGFVGHLISVPWLSVKAFGFDPLKAFVIAALWLVCVGVEAAIRKWWRSRREANKAS